MYICKFKSTSITFSIFFNIMIRSKVGRGKANNTIKKVKNLPWNLNLKCFVCQCDCS